MDSMETTTTDAAVDMDMAVAVAMEEDVVDKTPTSPMSMIITVSYHSSLP